MQTKKRRLTSLLDHVCRSSLPISATLSWSERAWAYSGSLRHPPGDVWGPPPEVTSQELPFENILVVLMLHQNMVAHQHLVIELMTLISWNDRSCGQPMARQKKKQGKGVETLKVTEGSPASPMFLSKNKARTWATSEKELNIDSISPTHSVIHSFTH